jgi:hypothetical protein
MCDRSRLYFCLFVFDLDVGIVPQSNQYGFTYGVERLDFGIGALIQ